MAKKWLQSRWQILAAFVISFLIPWLFCRQVSRLEPVGDSWTYTQLAKVFEEKGLLNLAAYASINGGSFRGVVFPWIIALCNATLGYDVCNCLLIAAVCAIALPRLMELIFGVTVPGWRRPLLSALFTLFYQGLAAYPLSDLWAAGLAIAALALLLEATRPQALALWKRLLLLVGCGVCLALSYNIRTIYLLLWFTAAASLLGLMLARRQQPWGQKALWALAMVVGVALGSLPQMAVNQMTFGTPSPLLMSSGANLFTNQLYNGIYEQKYETNGDSEYWDEGLNFLDPVGLEILDREAMTPEYRFEEGSEYLPGVGDYLRLALSYPLDFMGILGRHLVNMVDIRYPMIFLEQVEPNPVYPALNYLLMYLGLTAFVLYALKMPKGQGWRLWLLLALLLPTFAICLGAVETRFGLMLHLALWGCLCCLPNRQLLRGMKARHWVLLACGLAVFVCVMTAIGGAAMMNLADQPILYQ